MLPSETKRAANPERNSRFHILILHHAKRCSINLGMASRQEAERSICWYGSIGGVKG